MNGTPDPSTVKPPSPTISITSLRSVSGEGVMNQQPTTSIGSIEGRKAAVDARVLAPLRRRGVRLPELGIGIAVILVSVIGSLWWQSRGASPNRIAVAADDLRAGDILESDDLAAVSISSDDELLLLAAAEATTIVGQRVVTDIPAGTPLTRAQFSELMPLSSTESLVGVVVDASRAPLEIVAGDLVDVVALDRDLTGSDIVSSVVRQAQVWSVSVPTEVLDERSVTLRVPKSSIDLFVGHDEIHLMKAGS